MGRNRLQDLNPDSSARAESLLAAIGRLWLNWGSWVMASFLVCAGLYSGARVVQLQSLAYLSIKLDSSLQIEGGIRPVFLNMYRVLNEGDKFIEVNNVPVTRLVEMHGSIRNSSGSLQEFNVRRSDEDGIYTRRIIWLPTSHMPELSFSRDMSVESVPIHELQRWLIGSDYRLVGVNGQDVSTPARAASLQNMNGGWRHYSFAANNAPGDRLEIAFLRQDPMAPWTLWIMGLAYGCLGLVVHRLRSRSQSASVYLIFCVTGSLFFFLRAIPGLLRSPLEIQLFQVVLCLSFAPTALFVGSLSGIPALWDNKRRVLITALAWGGFLRLVSWMLGYTPFLFAWAISISLLLIILFVGRRVRSGEHSSEALEAKQLTRTVQVACLAGLLPSALYLISLNLFPREGPLQIWVDLSAIIFPVMIGYAVVLRNVLRVDEMLLESAAFGSLTAALGCTFAVAVAFVVRLSEQFVPAASPWAAALLAGVGAASALPLYIRARRWLEDRFNRRQSRYDDFILSIEEFGIELPDVDAFIRKVMGELRRLTESPDVAAIVLAHGDIGVFSTDSEAEVMDRREDWNLLCDAIHDQPREMSRSVVADSIGGDSQREEVVAAMDRLSILWLFPLMVESRFAGLLAVGQKADGLNYPRAELLKLRIVARECALGLYSYIIRQNMIDKRRTEEALRKSEDRLKHAQKLEVLGTLTTSVAHDFKNLITAIFGYTAIAKDTLPFDHPSAEAVQNVEEVARQAAGLTRSLLIFTNRMKSEKQTSEFAPILDRAIRFVTRVTSSSLDIELQTSELNGAFAHADETQIQQLLMNLVLNARDAMAGRGIVSVTAKQVSMSLPSMASSSASAWIRVSVADRGCGISSDVIERIFDPFFTTKSPEKGTGLGLAICRQVAEDHGGWIQVESRPSEGSCFEIFFPVCRKPSTAARSGVTAKETRLRGASILIAEDDDMVRAGITTFLRRRGFKVTAVANGHRFVEAATAEPPAACVLNFELPGLSAVECIASLSREGIRVPILLTSGDSDLVFDSDRAPGVRILRKPFKMSDLLHELTLAIEMFNSTKGRVPDE